MENHIYNHSYFGEICYLVNIPENLKGKKNLPLLIFLHGAGERGHDFDLIKVNGVPRYIESGMELPAVTVCPQCPENFIWNNFVFMLKEFIDFIVKEYDIDTSRISLTGISMGGFGTWEMAMCYPGLFRRIAPVCGGGTPWRANLISCPVRAFHGDKDNVVPPECSYQMVDAVLEAGGNARLTLFHNVEHASWDEAYLNTDVLKWLLED